MKESEIYSKQWRVGGGMGAKTPEGIIPIELTKYKRVRASFSTVRSRTFGNRRSYENSNHAHTRIFFDETTKTITIEGVDENAVNSWAGELELNLYAPLGGGD